MGLLDFPTPLARVDLVRLITNLTGLMRMHGARTLQTPMDVVHVKSQRPPFTEMATCVLESDRIAKAALSHVHATPFFAGVSVVIHPKIEAPVLVCDLRIVPTGRTRLFVDVCGDGTHAPSFMKIFHPALARELDDLPRKLKKRPPPLWLASISGGCGAQLEVGPFGGRDLERVMMRYVDAYLRSLDRAELTPASKNGSSLEALFKTHGRAGKYLTRAFGRAFAERYHTLVWNVP